MAGVQVVIVPTSDFLRVLC